MKRLAIGPVTSAPTWQWVGAGMAPELARYYDVTPFDDFSAISDADAVLIIKQRPTAETIAELQDCGQRVVYVMLDLNKRRKDVRAFVQALERWIIGTLWRFNVEGHIREGRVGVWVERRDKGYAPLTEDKIAAIGVKLRRWVSFHGVSLNVEPDLSHFSGIVPCGITEHGVTSLLDLGLPVTMDEVDDALKSSFETIFGPVER